MLWCMRIACWLTKATNTHPQYVTIIAFPLQEWLGIRASFDVICTLPSLLNTLGVTVRGQLLVSCGSDL
jgi:hypothetical protein